MMTIYLQRRSISRRCWVGLILSSLLLLAFSMKIHSSEAFSPTSTNSLFSAHQSQQHRACFSSSSHGIRKGPFCAWVSSSSSLSNISKRRLGQRVRGDIRAAGRLSASSSSSDGEASNYVVDVETENVSETKSRASRLRRAVRSSTRRVKSQIQNWMQKVVYWKQTKGRSLLAAAVMSLSVLLMSNQAISEHFHTTDAQQHQPQATEIHRVVPQSQSSLQQHHQMLASTTTRGGSTSFSSSSSNTRSFPSFGRDKKSSSMGSRMEDASVATQRTLRDAMVDLANYMQGPKSDTLLLLLATALITPICKIIGISPILGFLASGMLLGPNGCGLISGIHTTETLAELGIVFFLFEMGIELSFDRLLSMRKDVFGLGFCQFLFSSLAIAAAGGIFGGLPANALIVLGGGLALSSSAFVLQLLKDKNQMATRFGKASFGILLFQDLAVVPLLVVTPILAGSGSLASAVGAAVVKAGIALGSIAVAGRFVLNPLFKTVAQAQSQEAFLGVILLTVLSMSFMTEGLGLSNTLGAFLAGVLLSETKYRYQVEADIAPFRGILLGLFFVTVGFEIDLSLIAAQAPLVGGIVIGILALKAAVTTALSLAFGLSLPTSLQTGLILSQGGEFAFVAFGLARSLGILSAPTTKLLLTSVSLTMALTPLMATIGGRVAKQLEEKSDFTHYLGQDRDASEIKESDDFAVVVGYGAVGKIVCNVLDSKLIKYVGLEIDPNKAIQARNAGLPVFYGDIGRQEVAEAFNVGKAKAVIVCVADKQQANRAVIALRRWYPDLKIFARATNADHASRLQNTLNVAAMVPILPEDNLLLTLPFAGAVMKALGVPTEEVNAILTSKRREVLAGRGLAGTEEEFALVQLGIQPTIANATDSVIEDPLVGPGEGEKMDKAAVDKAAAARRQEALEKSPFVAEVIEDVCPGSVCIDDDDEFVEGDIVLEQTLMEGGGPGLIESSDAINADVSTVQPVEAAAASVTTEESVVGTSGANMTSRDESAKSSAVGGVDGGPSKDSSSPLTDDTNAFQ